MAWMNWFRFADNLGVEMLRSMSAATEDSLLRTAAFRSTATCGALPHQHDAIKHIIMTEMKESSVTFAQLDATKSLYSCVTRARASQLMQVEHNTYFIGFLIPYKREQQIRQTAQLRRAS